METSAHISICSPTSRTTAGASSSRRPAIRSSNRKPPTRRRNILSATSFRSKRTAAQRVPADLHLARRRAVRVGFAQGDLLRGRRQVHPALPRRVAQLPPLAQDRLARVLDRIHRPRHRPQGRREVPRPAPAAFQRRLSRGYHHLYKLALRTAQEQGSGFQQILAGIVNLLLGFAYAEHMQTALEDMQVAAQLNEAKIIMQGQLQPQPLLQEGRRAHLHELLAVPRLFRHVASGSPRRNICWN